MHVTFDHAEDDAQHIRTFWFKPQKRVDYVAGQFTELYLPHVDADGRGERRWFTLSSSPTEDLLSITTRLNPSDSSSYKKALLGLESGQPLHLADPMGDFVLPKDTHIPLVFVAGGLGITPVRSMVKYLHDRGEKRAIQLIYAVPDPSQAIFLPLFEEYGLRLTLVVKHSPAGYRGARGSLTTARIVRLAPDDKPLIYLSGPEPMVETFTKQLEQGGVAQHRLVTDYFPGYAEF